MLNFEYKGISYGKYVEGEIEALNNAEAAHKLKEQKVIITKLKEAKKKKVVVKKEKKSIRSRLYATKVFEDDPSNADFKSSHSFNKINCAGDMSSSLANDLFCAQIRFP